MEIGVTLDAEIRTLEHESFGIDCPMLPTKEIKVNLNIISI